MLDVVIATGNRHKFRELAALLAMRGIRYRSLASIAGAPRVAERGRTFEANAIAKARAVARAAGGLAIADDSGLEVEALRWEPSVRSARYAGRHGDDAANNAKLLRALRGLPTSRRRARYRCVLVLASPRRVVAVARGHWEGRIARRPRGSHGFGYDPLFEIPRRGHTVGELPASVKARLSHRARAARRLRPTLRQLVIASRAGPRRRAGG